MMECISSCTSYLFQMGYSKQEALDNIRDAAEIYIEDMLLFQHSLLCFEIPVELFMHIA